ncbi:MAG: serine hydrolase domain-containing protein, partial [Chitinophagaceae bacterium]
MQKAVLFWHFILMFHFQLLAQTSKQLLKETNPASAGVSEIRLKRLDQFIQKYIDDKQFNGTTAIIVRDGKIIYHKAFGYSDLQQQKVMVKDNIFRIASMTKPVISVAAMILFEEGKFSLDDPISKFIPAF